MRFKNRAEVLDIEGKRVGDVVGVAIDPKTHEITHVMVEKGFLFTKDRVIPIAMVKSASEEGVRLNVGADDLKSVPEYRLDHYVPVSDREGEEDYPSPALAPDFPPRAFWSPPPNMNWWSTANLFGYAPVLGQVAPPFVAHTHETAPEGTVVLDVDATVISKDGKKVGKVAQVLVDPSGERATHIVVSTSDANEAQKLIPTAWIQELLSENVVLSMDATFLEQLPDYVPGQ